MILLSWRSQEQVAMLRSKNKGNKGYEKAFPSAGSQTATERPRRREVNGAVPEGLPDRFYDENGEINLSKVSGADALRYFQAQGMPLPIIRR